MSKKKRTGTGEDASLVPKRKTSDFLGFCARIGLIAITAYLLGFVFFGARIYHGANMSPWMRDGDLVIINRRADLYPDKVISYRQGDDIKFGRIIGQAGDVIDINKDQYLLNGSVPMEKVFYDTKTDETSIAFPLRVEDGKVFILNDMREDTNDSRRFGCIKTEDVEGVVIFTASRRGF